ncbi:MAG: TrbC/VIRB2 family protein [Gammaproteobacteria bacterium]|nr:TrbC/VIRB2 family protein [Gammaproteobacteria bacterium]MBL4729715.1 TrbC/VIRB2 family protein [Gammaproteobacteria bacterium]
MFKINMEIDSKNKKNASFKEKRDFFVSVMFLMTFALFPETAAAANPWDNTINTIIGSLTGTTARLIAVLVCIGLGYAAWIGRLSWKLTGSFIGGIILVFGATAIADLFIDGTGT